MYVNITDGISLFYYIYFYNYLFVYLYLWDTSGI